MIPLPEAINFVKQHEGQTAEQCDHGSPECQQDGAEAFKVPQTDAFDFIGL